MQSDALDKTASLRVLQLHHELEKLLIRTRHAHALEQLRRECDAADAKLRLSVELSAVTEDIRALGRRLDALEAAWTRGRK